MILKIWQQHGRLIRKAEKNNSKEIPKMFKVKNDEGLN